MERIIRSHIRVNWNNAGIISNRQHGFSPHFSTVTNLLVHMDLVTDGLIKVLPLMFIYLFRF